MMTCLISWNGTPLAIAGDALTSREGFWDFIDGMVEEGLDPNEEIQTHEREFIDFGHLFQQADDSYALDVNLPRHLDRMNEALKEMQPLLARISEETHGKDNDYADWSLLEEIETLIETNKEILR